MAKFNIRMPRRAPRSPITSEAVASGATFEGAPGYARDAKSELFLLAVTNMVGEATFYEGATDRDTRFEALVHTVSISDPQWTAAFLRWLRGDANMRSAALVGAAHYVRARLDAGVETVPGSPVANRRVVDSVLVRADEPGEFLAYWTSRFGRAIPKPVKRGVADAVTRLYTERNLLKYDTATHGFRFGDVLDLTHPAPAPDKPWQGDLFAHALDRRHHRGNDVPASLAMVLANARLRADAADDPTVLLDPDRLRAAGMTWEDVLSLAGPTLDKARLWSSVIPSMGYMALLRNVRNFDEAGVPDDVALRVAAKLADAREVAASRQLPMRFLSAHRAARSQRWGYALEQALGHALSNVPSLGGRTLILVDTSGSMHAGFSQDGTLMRWDAAVLFGLALAARCAAVEVVSFSSSTRVFPSLRGESLVTALERWRTGGWFLNGGTNTGDAVRAHYRRHDRVVILTDEQAAGTGAAQVTGSVPAHVPVYTWNLAGYRHGHAPSGTSNRHVFGGLTDAAFRMIPLLEAGRDGRWPWESSG